MVHPDLSFLQSPSTKRPCSIQTASVPAEQTHKSAVRSHDNGYSPPLNSKEAPRRVYLSYYITASAHWPPLPTMPGILPMKVIKVGANAQSRIAQACDRCVQIKIERPGTSLITCADAEARRSAAMAYDHAALNAPMLGSNARRAIS